MITSYKKRPPSSLIAKMRAAEWACLCRKVFHNAITDVCPLNFDARLEIAAIETELIERRCGSVVDAKSNTLSCFHCVTKTSEMVATDTRHDLLECDSNEPRVIGPNWSAGLELWRHGLVNSGSRCRKAKWEKMDNLR